MKSFLQILFTAIAIAMGTFSHLSFAEEERGLSVAEWCQVADISQKKGDVPGMRDAFTEIAVFVMEGARPPDSCAVTVRTVALTLFPQEIASARSLVAAGNFAEAERSLSRAVMQAGILCIEAQPLMMALDDNRETKGKAVRIPSPSWVEEQLTGARKAQGVCNMH